MNTSTHDTTKRRKRPDAPGTPVMVRLQPGLLAKVDAWIGEDEAKTRPVAIREMIEAASKLGGLDAAE